MLRHLLAILALGCSACSAANGGDGDPSRLAIDRPGMQAGAALRVSSRAFGDGEVIPDRYADGNRGVSPPLAWSGVPQDARSLVLIVEDPDAPTSLPFLHWAAWNIDPALGGLPENVAGARSDGALKSMVEGRNGLGQTGYFGPKPPGSKVHRYHFELFALDRTLALDPDAKRSDLLAAMAGHVLADGQFVGLYRRP